MKTSLFELFKIGIGPSSSHTVGPMRAAREFVLQLASDAELITIDRVQIELFGSLALTGHGHATDKAILLGLSGEMPDSIEISSIESMLADIRANNKISLLGSRVIKFDELSDIVFRKGQSLPGHSNAMRFTAFKNDGTTIRTAVIYSTGGGFIQRQGEIPNETAKAIPPYPFVSAQELLVRCSQHDLAIWQVVLENEKTWRDEAIVCTYLDRVWAVMQQSIDRGLATEGILPGGLKVRRRAPGLKRKLERKTSNEPLTPMDWVNVYAMAVNEENAAGGRVVTAPTNGAAGIIPAVGKYYERFVPGASLVGIRHYLLTAAAIGVLYKENASISGAEVGCQGEVGVACSMAAGGLVAALGGSNSQVESAAEIAMEHNLGMTCDPVAGLVQIPCIERNAMGSVKAINACRIAMDDDSDHKVSLDQVIATMYQTGLDMQSRYKETSQGGLALNVIEC